MTFTEFSNMWACSKKDGEIHILGYKGDKTEETIPAEIEGVPITILAKGKKRNNPDYKPLQVLNINANIQGITNDCFAKSDLVKINLPDSLTYIGDSAFYLCESLTDIVLPNNLRQIQDAAFNSCSKLRSIIVPKSVTNIGIEVFCECNELTKAEVLADVEVIPETTFMHCPMLEEVIISASVKEIEKDAFYNCKSLKKVTFLGDMPTLGEDVFVKTPVEKEFEKFISEFVFVKNSDNSVNLNKYLGKSTHVIIPDEFEGNPVTSIYKYAFGQNCEQIETLVLPKYLKKFNDISYAHLMNLKKITFLNEETKLNYKFFEYLNKLEEIDFFAWKHLPQPQLYNVFLKKLGEWDTFDSEIQKQILSIIKKSSKIKKNLFLSNNSDIVAFLIAQKININLETIDEILDHYTKLEMTTITAMLLNYKNKKFSKEVVEKAKELDELVEIGFELPTLKQLKQKWNVGKVAGGLRISGYKGSNTVETIPTGTAEGDLIVSIGFSKTNDFSPIQTLVIDAKIETLSEKTFYSCHSLTSIKLPDTLKSIGFQAFYECRNLVDIVIPDRVKIIEGYAFWQCNSIETIIIPDSVRTFGIGVFIDCINLSKISLPSNIKEIPHWGFKNCCNLKEINIPNTLQIINHFAFQDCIALEKIVFPKSLKFIDTGAFLGCDNLKIVEVNSNAKFGVDVFKGTPVEKEIFNG